MRVPVSQSCKDSTQYFLRSRMIEQKHLHLKQKKKLNSLFIYLYSIPSKDLIQNAIQNRWSNSLKSAWSECLMKLYRGKKIMHNIFARLSHISLFIDVFISWYTIYLEPVTFLFIYQGYNWFVSTYSISGKILFATVFKILLHSSLNLEHVH